RQDACKPHAWMRAFLQSKTWLTITCKLAALTESVDSFAMHFCHRRRKNAKNLRLKETLKKYLVCPNCASSLEFSDTECEGAEIITGGIHCSDCSQTWPIMRGVPRFAA